MQAAESSTHESIKRTIKSNQFTVSNVANTRLKASCSEPAKSMKHVSFLACKVRKHLLYSCSRFMALPCRQCVAMANINELCNNCLKPGHFWSQCQSAYRCKVCQKLHHILLHRLSGSDTWTVANPTVKGSQSNKNVLSRELGTYHSHVPHPDTSRNQKQAFHMTCQVKVSGPDGYVMKARALVDSASSTSLITELLVQQLQLPR